MWEGHCPGRGSCWRSNRVASLPSGLLPSCRRAQVDGRQELLAGSAEEVEIRAATVAAVEAVRQAIAAKLGGVQDQQGAELALPNAIQLDWFLWEQGERARRAHRPHHRTLTIYY